MSQIKQKKQEESGPKVPAYIVTFSDMITLLLTFFVMLLSLAEVQDPELFNVSRDSFTMSLDTMGFGLLTGKMDGLKLRAEKVKYRISHPDEETEDRVIDFKKDNIQRIFEELKKSMRTMPSQIVSRQTDFTVTNITFSPESASLDNDAKTMLSRFVSDLRQGSSGDIKLYVLGLASDVRGEKNQMILSSRRARAAANHLESIIKLQTFNGSGSWPVYSWGAGDGGDWVNKNSPAFERSQILIAVLRSDEHI